VVVARDDEYVDRSLRVNVTERDRARIAGHYGRRYLGGSNTAEQALGHGEDLNVYRAGDAADIYGCSTANPRCTAPLVQRPRQLLAFCRSGMSHARVLMRRHRWAWGEVQFFSRAGLITEYREDP